MCDKSSMIVERKQTEVIDAASIIILFLLAIFNYSSYLNWSMKRFASVLLLYCAAVWRLSWIFSRSFPLRRQNSICNRLEMTTKLSHPYKDHPEPWQWPKEYTDDIEEIYEWFAFITRWTLNLSSSPQFILGWFSSRASPKWPKITSTSFIMLVSTAWRRRKKLSIDTLR